MKMATVNGKYSELLRKIRVDSDRSTYGDFYDYGAWEGDSWGGYTDLPAGYWVYVYPHWYIFKAGDLSEGDLAGGEEELGVFLLTR